MTATAPPRRPQGPPAQTGGPSAGPRRPARPPAHPALRRTGQALLGGALGMIPLKGLFSNYGWLVDVWVTMIIVIGPAMWLRRRRAPGALDIWPGIILLIPWLTLRFVPGHAIGGFIPTPSTWDDVSALLRDLHDTTSNSVAPIHTTVAVELVVCALLGLLAALIDLIAVVGHRGALAGVPLLIVYTVAGAVPRQPVSWIWFLFAAAGYLLLLGLDAGDELDNWGRRFRSSRRGPTPARWSVATPRIVAAAVIVAVLAPLVVPAHSRNLIANAFHGNGGNGLGGFGGGGGSIAPFVQLKGQLDDPTPYPMADVHVSNSQGTSPFYLRSLVLEDYTGDGWRVGDHGSTESIDGSDFPTRGGGGENSVSLTATVTVSGLTSTAPIFAKPTRIDGLDSGTTWSSNDQTLLGSKVHKGQRYTEVFEQPAPTVNQLTAATAHVGGSGFAPTLQLPGNVPDFVDNLATQLTRNETSPYEQARAINDYFTDPANGFVYSLKTKTGDSGSVLVDFLKNKQGFCQQYAAAMAVMLRDIKIPARVVLGYMHSAPDQDGNFQVSSAEAHSWVEAYFAGIGWIPFDPTPAAGLVGGTRTDLSWAPHSYAADGNDVPTKGNQTTAGTSSSAPVPTTTAPTSTAPQASSAASSTSLVPLWWVLGALVVVAIVFYPMAVRAVRRRRRYQRAGRDGDADALWAELSDTAIDLGYVWSLARTPRQVATWLGRDVGSSASALRALAVAVERGRYSGGAVAADDEADLARGLRAVTGDLRSGRSFGTRLRSVLWPASLGWARWFPRSGRRTE